MRAFDKVDEYTKWVLNVEELQSEEAQEERVKSILERMPVLGITPSANHVRAMGVRLVDVERKRDEVRVAFSRWIGGLPGNGDLGGAVVMGHFRIGPFTGRGCGDRAAGARAIALQMSRRDFYDDALVADLRDRLAPAMRVLERVYAYLNGGVEPLRTWWHILHRPWVEEETCFCSSNCGNPTFRSTTGALNEEQDVPAIFKSRGWQLHPCYLESPVMRPLVLAAQATCFEIDPEKRAALVALEKEAGEKKPIVKKAAEKRVKRNDPCPCGSGKKAKACCHK